MKASNIPARIGTAFGKNAGAGFIRPIPVASQIGIQNGAASFQTGFPPDTFDPVGAGGTPPFGQDFNGLFNQITLWNQWQAAGGPQYFNADFATAIGGYPQGAVLNAAVLGYYWFSTIDDNANDPETSGVGWQSFTPLGNTTGMMAFRWTLDAVPGYVIGNGTTIGNATSGATQLASAIAVNLFAYFWNQFSNTRCPVSGGRGATAAADFAAGKTIGTPQTQGLGAKGMDTMGGVVTTLLNGVPVVVGSATAAGSILGENLHGLVEAENANHGHVVNDPTHTHPSNAMRNNNDSTFSPGGAFGIPQSSAATIQPALTGITLQSSGTGAPHNTVDRSMVGAWYFKI